MTAPLARVDLDTMPCDACGQQGHVHELVARCHPLAGLRASYREGVLVLECLSCGAYCSSVHVAVSAPVDLRPLRTRAGRRELAEPLLEALRRGPADVPLVVFQAALQRFAFALGATDGGQFLERVNAALETRDSEELRAIAGEWIALAPETDGHVH